MEHDSWLNEVIKLKKYTPEKFKHYCHNPNAYIQKTPINIEKMAFGVMRYLIDKELFEDVRIYYHKGKTWYALQNRKPDDKLNSTQIDHSHGKSNYMVYKITDIDPHDYFEYNGDYLSMSFEGPLYECLNHTIFPFASDHINDHLRNYFSHYGLYFELGNQWNLSLYDI